MTGVALSIVRSASQQLASSLVKEAKFLYAVNEKMEKLLLNLECMQCFLEDAEKHNYTSRLIRRWIFQIREFAYEAENIIDKYIVRVGRHREEGVWNGVKWFSCIAPEVVSLHEVGSDIDTLSGRIAELTSIMQLCGLKVDVTQDSGMMVTQLAELRRTNAHIEDDDTIVGFNEDVSNLVHYLVNTDKMVVAICGMGGSGKTTLAKMVCNNKTIKLHFDDFVWVYLSQQFSAKGIIELIGRRLFGDMKDVEHTHLQNLCEDIKNELHAKKYLVVLDDIWNEESWDRLKDIFPLAGESSNKLLLTTRNLELIKHVDQQKGCMYQPSCLTAQQSWELLLKITSKGGYKIDNEMEKLGKKMIEHCECLPLAVATLGGILRSKTTADKWRVVNDNIHSYLTSGEGSMVMQVLELSYRELPFYLRPCFLYLASFPEDSEIEASRLYHMWIAERLVIPPSDDNAVDVIEIGNSMDDMAEKYLNELVKRCLVQVVERENRGLVQTCRVHDIVRTMCIKMAKEENFLSIATGKKILDVQSSALSNYSSSASNCRLHRFAIHLDDAYTAYSLVKIPTCRHIRSLFIYSSSEYTQWDWLRGLMGTSSMIRVLHLQHMEIVSFKEIGNLIHLRYLDMRNALVKRGRIPSSLGNLVHLETLDLRVYGMRRGGSFSLDIVIPNVLWKLSRLRHLYLPQFYACTKFEKLEIQSLKLLETLENFFLRHWRLEGLYNLGSLRKFVWGVRNSVDHKFESKDKKLLAMLLAFHATSSSLCEKSLSLELSGEVLSEEYAKELIQLSGYKLSVQGLTIRGKVTWKSLDSIKMVLQNLKYLALSSTGLENDPMPVLERLLHLEKLKLLYRCFTTRKMTCSAGGFPQLTFLELGFLDVSRWDMDESSMPKLTHLEIYCCKNLKQPPHILVERIIDTRYTKTSRYENETQVITLKERVQGISNEEELENNKIILSSIQE